jgi:outer membrane protein OmpA-like peptidoglycan-associated protein
MTERTVAADAQPEVAPALLQAPGRALSQRGATRERVLALQRSAGNAAVGRVLAREGRRTLARQPLATDEPAVMTRAEEIAASRRSEGEVTAIAKPPTISLYAFAIDDATLKARHRALLAELADTLKHLPPGAVNVLVVGHADASGEPRVNDPLSARRAVAVAKALRRLGVRVDADARGENEPFATDDTVESRSRNRRVDLILLPAKPLGRKPPDDDTPPPPPDDNPPPPPPPEDDKPPPEDDKPPPPPKDDKPPKDERDPSWCERHPIICGLPIFPPIPLPLINPIWLCLLNPAVCLIPLVPKPPKPPEPPGGDEPPKDPEPDEPDPPRVTIGHVRHEDTPDGMYDRIPPRVTNLVEVTVEGRRPDSPPIMLTVVGGGGYNGVALVDGDTTTELVSSGTVLLEGTEQTDAGGHRGGALRLVATMGATVLAESNYFAVSAIPKKASATYIRPLDDGTLLGMEVANAWVSDSNEASDLDKVRVREVIETKDADGVFKDHPPTSFNPDWVAGHEAPFSDKHAAKVRTLDGPGTLDNQQVLKFEDLRSGSREVPMEGSGFGIKREVRPIFLGVGLELETSKEARAGDADGFTSGAGETDPDPIVEVQTIPPKKPSGGGGGGSGGRPPKPSGGGGSGGPGPAPKPSGGGGGPTGVPSSREVTPRPFPGKVSGTFDFGYVSGLPLDPEMNTNYPVRIGFRSEGSVYTAVVGFAVTNKTPTHVEMESTNTEPLNVAPEGDPPLVIEAGNPAVISYDVLRRASGGHSSAPATSPP